MPATTTSADFTAQHALALDLLDNCSCCTPCPDFPFWFVVTVTGGSFPFTWAGKTWSSSGQSLPVCGVGTQGDYTVTPYYFSLPYQNWEAGGIGFGVSAATVSYAIGDIGLFGPTTSPFSLFLSVRGLTWATGYYYSVTSTSINSYTPTKSALWNGLEPATVGRLSDAHSGSITTTAGRTISWTPSPSMPWDFYA